MKTASKRAGSKCCFQVVDEGLNETTTASKKDGRSETIDMMVNRVVMDGMESQLDMGCKAWKVKNNSV
jgi:hypothetical protein